MTTPIVPSISDEELADIEKAACRSYGETTIVSKQEIASIIARLRAAEADAKRYRHLLENAVIKHSAEQTPVLVCPFDLPLNDWRNEVNRRIDAAVSLEAIHG